MNRSTKVSFDSGRNMKEFEEKELSSPTPDRLNEELVKKKKGYCVIHSS